MIPNKSEVKSNHPLISELGTHLPFTIFSVATGLIFLGLITFVSNSTGQLSGKKEVESLLNLYHLFHPLHILFSAMATTAMFWRYDRKWIKAVVIGILGSIGICGLSDIFVPYVAGFLLGVHMELHICIIQHSMLVVPFLFFGIITGFLVPKEQKSTIISHAFHVLLSTMASILYLVGHGLTDWIHMAGMVFFYTVIAVMLPCCTSDIIFPLLLVNKKKTACHERSL
jgi:hypothetical protein